MHFKGIAALLTLLCIGSGCAPAMRTAERPMPSAADGERQEVLRRQDAWVEAAIRRDVLTFGEHMDDLYHRVGPGGRVRGKQEWMESIRATQTTYATVEYYNLSVQIYGDIAVVSGEYRQRATSGGQDNTGQGVAVHTWIKRDGQWRVLASIYPGTVNTANLR